MEKKIGDLIYYMRASKIEAKKIKGISILEGEIYESGMQVKLEPGVIQVNYHTNSYTTIPSGEAYDTKEDLIKGLLADIKSDN